jgi:hypothetical protein
MSNAGIVSRWVISLVIVPNRELTLVVSVTIASLLVHSSLPLILTSDHMSRDCPQPRQGGYEKGRRTERDTLSGDPRRKYISNGRQSCHIQ